MRSALLCVFFALVIQKEGRRTAADDDFKPMPIPLTEWHYDRRASRVGTLHEAVNTDSPPSVAAVPAHYWEDALRHSVYLTLVRDKIDQLIQKSTVSSPDSKRDQYVSKETDDHDLWDKIKNAPFDRKRTEDYTAFGDVTIMAKGRLLEQKEGFRFTEDEKTNDKCEDESCMKGVKAFWSVKRVRQRDEETSPGKYHYELTFSVMSQAPKKLKKPHDNPVRTFTVRENPPDIVTGRPQQIQNFYKPHQTYSTAPRPQRAIWFHKNLVPSQSQARRYHQGLDRIFSSFFGDDDSPPEPPRYRPNIYTKPTYSQHGKQGHAPTPNDQNQQKKLMPYPYKPPTYKYVRPPLAAPPAGHGQHHYADLEPMLGNSFAPQSSDHRYVAPSNIIKTTRPAVLPTPSEPFLVTSTKTYTHNANNIRNNTENTTRESEVSTAYKIYNKPKPTHMKVSYFPEHLRPPVYNAPPGVFVTMDKKPFKPMPPLKYIYSNKPMKNKPTDFRPSPQLLDIQFSDPSDSLVDSEFRPILTNVKETENKTNSSLNSKKGDKHFRKPTVINKKQKKHENIKSLRGTTSAPDIITAVNIDSVEEETPEWANVIGAFTKTTPMESQKDDLLSTTNDKDTHDKDITFSSSTTVSSTVNKKKRVSSSTSTTTEESIVSTSLKPTRRTRPPPKFTKLDKNKKHKRVSTTTQKTLSMDSLKFPNEDLTPQASSGATRPNKPLELINTTASTINAKIIPQTVLSTRPSTSTTTTEKTTTTSTIRSTTTVSARIASIEPTIGTSQSKNKNRFRQSTLMQKGTSVNHDKWSINVERNKTILPPTGKFNARRKGSNFQGHVTTSKPKTTDIDHKEEDHADTSKSKIKESHVSPTPTQIIYEDTADQYESNSELPSSNISYDQEDNEEYEKENTSKVNENESDDHKEYIFDLTSITPNEETNEVGKPEASVKEQTITESKHAISTNKTKCKKKKHHNFATSNESLKESSIPLNAPTTSTTTTTTIKPSTDILEDLFGGYTYDDTTDKTEGSQTPSLSELHEEESEKHEKYVHIDEDFEDFLDVLEKEKQHDPDGPDVDQYEDDDSDKNTSPNEDFSPFDNESEDESSRQVDDDTYEDYSDRSLSFLELMAME